ncbi:MAG: PRC-barrel domain-containing protein [Bacillota bacterium]|nr:PRC-barrel domain-containing protein [Bacillota bacterium]MDW7683647.1 PRC-barrel domain-containing protein [Bacillota bacterium]
MKKSREVMGLPVVDLSEGKSLGRVYNLVVNPAARRVEALEVGERTLLKAKTQLVPFAKLRSIGSDAVTITDNAAIDDADEHPELASFLERKLVGSRIVTVDGTSAGIVSDFSFDPANGILADLFLSTGQGRTQLMLPVSSVENFGRDFIIIKEDYLAEARETDAPPVPPSGQQIAHSLEVKAIEFAIGREAGQDVLDGKGEPVVRKGQTVTTEIIDLAREKNRLTQVLIAAGVGELLEGIDFTREKLDAGSKRLIDAWHTLRGRSHEWLSRRLDDDRPSPTGELRELWYQLQGKLEQGGRELEEQTMQSMRNYVVGKTLAHPVYSREGTLLAGRGDIVTEMVRDNAEEAGRLQQLFLSAAAADVQMALDPIKKQIKDILGE